MLERLFIACLAPVAFSYLLYPLLVAVAGRLFRRSESPPPAPGTEGGEAFAPRVSILIPAHDEEAVIGDKIRNCMQLDYPQERIEIFVLSDGSRDGTVDNAIAAAGAAGEPGTATLHVRIGERRRGKTACINEAVPRATGEILVHTDANSSFPPDALGRIVAPFRDPRVGCVVGELVYTNIDEPAVAGGEGIYWRYENFVKESESMLGCTITANGGIYAIRRDLFEPLPAHIAGDAADPLLVARRGYMTLFERRARAFERASSSLSEEFERKVRIITQGLAAYVWIRGLLVPPRPWLAFEYLSHKLLRWVAPFLLLGALGINLLLVARPFWAALLAAQAAFYALGLAGIFIASRGGPGRGAPSFLTRLPLIAGYFCVVNAAAARGVIDYIRGVRRATWEKSVSTRT